MSTLIDRLCSTPEERKLLQREATILEATELVCQVMEEEGVSRAELAKRLGVNPGHVARALGECSNMTLTDLSDMLWAMGRGVRMTAEPKGKETT